jgi:2-polyprenyl-3-methyl-5-hydroxy-6-metoxy-1,4-benzoquinol methylase
VPAPATTARDAPDVRVEVGADEHDAHRPNDLTRPMSKTENYDALWRGAWGDIQRVGPVHRHMHEDLMRVVSALDVRTILDAGCGSGDALALLAATGRYELCGTDLSPEALELARERAPGVRLEVLDVEHAALAETFDLVTSVQVVEHLVDDVAALGRMAEMSSGYVYISTMAGRMRPSERSIGHVRNYSDVELRTKLELAGLEVLWMRGWGFPFYSPLYRTAAEWLPSGPPSGQVGTFGALVARGLYQLYRLNVPGRGDVISALARKRG